MKELKINLLCVYLKQKWFLIAGLRETCLSMDVFCFPKLREFRGWYILLSPCMLTQLCTDIEKQD